MSASDRPRVRADIAKVICSSFGLVEQRTTRGRKYSTSRPAGGQDGAPTQALRPIQYFCARLLISLTLPLAVHGAVKVEKRSNRPNPGRAEYLDWPRCSRQLREFRTRWKAGASGQDIACICKIAGLGDRNTQPYPSTDRRRCCCLSGFCRPF